MSNGLLSTAISGMSAAQIGLQTAEHNITNQNTPGFSRQRIVQASNIALLTGSGYLGQGVHVSTVERMYDSFLVNQVNRAQTAASELQAYYEQISQIDNMLADANAGLSPALKDFFNGVQQVAANPTQLAARQSMVSSAQSLVTRFQGLEDRISQLYDDVNSQITAQVASVNAYAQQIADLNQRIILAQSSIGQPANDLLDQRDQLVSELNKLVQVTTTTNTDGSFNVFFGTGQQLVVGARPMTMTATPSIADPSRIAIGLSSGPGVLELPESLITGGSLGGLVSFRSETLDKAANELGRTAVSLALTFNAQHALGQDLNGNIAGNAGFVANFFSVSSPKVVANTHNPVGAPTVTASFQTPDYDGNFYTNLTGSDYRLDYDGTNLTLTRLSDGANWSGATVAVLNANVAASAQGAQGFTVAASGAFVAGSSYLIQPTRDGARNIAVNATIAADVRQIAVAAPIRTQVGTTNSGNATMSPGSVVSGYTAPAAATPYTLTFNGGNLTGFPAGTVTVTSGTTTTTYTYPAPDASVPFTNGATISFAGISFEINGSPANGDTFQVARNVAGVSDSRNALALGKLQTQNTMSGQSATFQSAYAQLVSDIGNKARQVSVMSDAQQSLLSQSEDARDALSGVNLDEEAANLLRYQQAYQAAAKSVQVSSELFDALLGAMN